MTESNFLFFNNCTTPTTSNPLISTSATELYIQVDGDATDFEIQILGSVNSKSERMPLAGINLGLLDIAETIKSNGLYTYDIKGIYSVVAELKYTDGSVSCFGRSVR